MNHCLQCIIEHFAHKLKLAGGTLHAGFDLREGFNDGEHRLMEGLVCRANVTLAAHQYYGNLNTETAKFRQPVRGYPSQGSRFVHAETEDDDAGFSACCFERLLVFWPGACVGDHHGYCIWCGIGGEPGRWQYWRRMLWKCFSRCSCDEGGLADARVADHSNHHSFSVAV